MAAKKAPKKSKTSKKKAAKRAGGRPKAGQPTKADFIRAKLAEGMSAGDIIKAAAADGTKISAPQIYKLKAKAKGSAPKRGPGPAATKTSAPKAGKLTASDFIRQHPGKTATELVELGKGQGLKFSGNLVYAVRAYDRKGAGAPKGKPGRKPGGNVATRASVTGDVAAFKKMALEIGFPRAREIVVALERKWNDLLA